MPVANDIFSPVIGLNAWMQLPRSLSSFETMQENGVLPSPVSSPVNLNYVLSGSEVGAISAYGKRSFTDTTDGFFQGMDTDGEYKWVMGGADSRVDWNVTTADTLTIIGSLSVGSDVGGWTITADTIYSLSSGTPTSSPNDGIVLDSSDPVITIYEDTEKRIELGFLSAGVFGLKGYGTNGTDVLFELSDTQVMLAGWTISTTTLANSTNIILNSSTSAISINDATFGADGIQLEYNSGNPRAYIGDGANQFFQFDGTNVSWDGSASSLSTAGKLTTTSATIGGWEVVSGYIYNLQSGTPTAAPNDGIVLSSGDEGIIVYEDTAKRAEFGFLSAGVYGLKVYDGAGSVALLELSDTQAVIAGWTIVDGYLYGLASGTPAAAPNDGIVLASGSSGGMIVYEDTAKRVEVGFLSAGVYGLKVYDGAGSSVLFEASDSGTTIANFTIAATSLSSGTLTSAIITTLASGSDPSLSEWTYSGAITVTDADTVAWAGGTLTLSTGQAFTITGSNTGNMVARTYIYFDSAVSTTVFQTTTTLATAVGSNKILIATAVNSTGEALFFAFNKDEYNIDAANIRANSITANEITAGTITTNEIAANTILAGNIAAGTITTTEIAANTILAGNIAAATITTTEIAATTIVGSNINTLNIAGKDATFDTGTVGGWNMTTAHLYGLASGTPTSSPNDGVVLASGSSGGLIVYEDTAKRVEVGFLSTGVYGLKGYATDGTTTIFELSDTQQLIGGFSFTGTTIAATNLTFTSGAANVANISVGTGSNLAGINAGNSGTDIAFWAGDTFANRAVAEFRVNLQGDLVATSATVNGSTLGFQDIFGDGSDGDVVISGNTTLTSDMFYDDLTIDSGFNLNTANYRIHVKGTLTVNGTIRNNGNNGSAGGNASSGTAGTSGAGGTAGTDGTVKAPVAGGAGGQGADAGQSSAAGTAGTSLNPGLGVAGAAGGAGQDPGGSDDAGGAAGTVTAAKNKAQTGFGAWLLQDFSPSQASIGSSAASGGGGGGDRDGGANAGGGGGGGGSPGGIVVIYAKSIVVSASGVIQSAGGNGGNGGNGFAIATPDQDGGGGGGGGAGSGGVVLLVYSSLTNSGTISAPAGSVGAGGLGQTNNAPNPDQDGTAGSAGTAGTVIQLVI